MSLLSSEQLVVAIHERGIDALRVRRGRLPRSPASIVERQRLDVDTAPAEPGDAAPWQRSVALLRELGSTGVRQLHLVVSNHFVRYQLLPWDSVVACNGDTQALARARFQLAFGDAAAAWHVVADAPRWRAASLAAALDGGLLAAASEMAAASGMQIASVRPHLFAALDHWQAGGRRKVPAAGWFAVFEPGRLSVLGSAPGGALSLHNMRLHAPDALLPTLQQCVAADRLKSALDGDVYLQAAGWSGDDAALATASVHRVDGQASVADGDFGQAMAACGSL